VPRLFLTVKRNLKCKFQQRRTESPGFYESASSGFDEFPIPAIILAKLEIYLPL
jgi:hypothetical protein